MTDHKFTDEEIVELLNAYVERMCGKCNVKDLGTCCGTCFITAISQAADLINRQKVEIESLKIANEKMYSANKEQEAEIERLNKEVDRLSQCVLYHDGIVSDLERDLFNAKAEAIKEFAERFKEIDVDTFEEYDKWGLTYVSEERIHNAIDTLVKEMTEGKNA